VKPYVKGKLEVHHRTSHEGPEGRSINTLSLTSELDGGGWSRSRPSRIPRGRTRYPLHGRLCGPQSRSGRARKISPLPSFDPRTVQPLASRYTDWVIAATEDACTHMAISRWILRRMRNVSYKSCRENRNTYYVQQHPPSPPKIVQFKKYLEKYDRGRQATGESIIQCIRFACWVTEATDTH